MKALVPAFCLLLWLGPSAMGQQAGEQAAMRAYDALSKEQLEDAARAFDQALSARPPLPDQRRAQLAADYGFLLDRLERRGEAAAAFAIALDIAPTPLLARAQAYALLAERRYDEAAEAFRLAIRLDPEAKPEQREMLRREVRSATRRFAVEGYSILRAETASDELTLSGPTVTGSQGGASADWQPGPLKRWDIQISGRLLWAYDGASLQVTPESLQSGIGLKWRPFRSTNLVLGAERLLAIGDFARNDTLLRASWSSGRGYQPPPGRRTWFYWSQYVDAAIIRPVDPDWVFSTETQVGWGFRLGGGFFVRPVLAHASIVQQSFGEIVELSEIGPGVFAQWTAAGTTERAGRFVMAMEVRWRQKLAGTASNLSGLTASLIVRF